MMSATANLGNGPFNSMAEIGLHTELVMNQGDLAGSRDTLHKLESLRDHIQETIGFTFSARIKAEMSRTLAQVEADIQRLQAGSC